VDVHLPPFERQGTGPRIATVRGRTKQSAINALEKRREQTLVWGMDDEYATALAGRKPAVVQVVSIQRHQRSSKLLGQPVVFGIGGASELVFFQNEQHVPLETLAHEGNEAGGDIGVGIDPRPRGETLGVRRQFGREGAHS